MGKIFWILIALVTGCSFNYSPPSKVTADANDMLTDSSDSNDGDEAEFILPLLPDTDIAPADNDSGDTVPNSDDDVEHPLAETDIGETIPPVETVDADTTDTPADTDSDSDTAEPEADSSDAQDTQDVEIETSLLCIPNCAGKQCGDDGCDGSCGTCSDNFTCTADFVCECVVGCQIPAEPQPDAYDATDTDTGATASADIDAQAEILPDAVIAPETTDDAEAPEADSMTGTEAEALVDTAIGETNPDVEPDVFVQPCLANLALCDDGNICTDDYCDPVAGCGHTNNTAPCDDGNSCTDNDACKNGVCVKSQPVVCNDNNPCTDDYCQKGIGCVFEWVCECLTNAACDDLNLCTNDVCASGFCEYTFNAIACDDNNKCTSVDKCAGGECLGIAPLNCNDGNECTQDECLAATGCKHSPKQGAACNDNNACTKADFCKKDVCVGEAIACNDNNPCTDDSCAPQSGCVYTPNSSLCTDDNLCTEGDKCGAGLCIPGKMKSCSDSDPCTYDVCEAEKGNCLHLPLSDVSCDDNNSCTANDKCLAGICKSNMPVVCDDFNLCTDNACFPAIGCVYTPNTLPCDDNKACTANDVCANGQCVSGTAVDCNDLNPCTDDSCDNTLGCVFIWNTKECSDGDACTTGDTCGNGVCAGQSIKCDDSNVCTDDACNPATGCVFTNNTADCDDGTVCTIVDVCQGGKCVGTAPLDCDDNDQCTLDVCNKTLGCQHSKVAMNGKPCDNNDACTVNDTCQNGMCKAGTQTCECYTTANCAGMEDGNFCNGTLVCNTAVMPHKCALDPATVITCPITSDTTCSKNTCQPISGKCEMKAVNEGVTCQTGQCLASATCQLGQCAVVNKPDGTACDDGKACNVDSCQSGICKGSPFAEANFDTGVLDAGWKTTTTTPASGIFKINSSKGFTSSPNALISFESGPGSVAVLTSPVFTLPSKHTSSLIFDFTMGQGNQIFVVELHNEFGSITLLEQQQVGPMPWTHYILPLDNNDGEMWLTFSYKNGYLFDAIDSISIGCP